MRLKVGGRFRERLVVTLEPLPIDASLHEVMAALQRSKTVLLMAPPGSGKTTRVPPAMLQMLGASR